MTLFCLLVPHLASPVALHMGSLVLFGVYWMALDTMQIHVHWEILYCDMQFTGEFDCLHGDDNYYMMF